jgi:2-iminobutanoate/2-iminopropanoate deaminase
MRQVVVSDRLPKPAGPYSPAVIAGDFVYVSGQGPSDPATGRMVTESVQAETRQVLKNIQAILEAAGTSMANVVKCNVYLADRRDFAAMNEVYAEFFPSEPPARTTVEAHPPVEIRVEIDCVAYLPRRS